MSDARQATMRKATMLAPALLWAACAQTAFLITQINN
jgi:hypothetical protein